MSIIDKIFNKYLISAEDYALLQNYKRILHTKSRKILLDASEQPDHLVSIDYQIIEKAIEQAVYFVRHSFSPSSLILIISEPSLMGNKLRSLGQSLLYRTDGGIEINSFKDEMNYLTKPDTYRIENKKLAREKISLFSSNLQHLFQLAGKKDGALFFNGEGDLCGTLQNIEGVTRKSVEHILENINHAGSGTTATAYIAFEVPETLAVKVSGEGEEKGRILAFLGPKFIFQYNPKKYKKPLIDMYNIFKK